MFVWIFGCCEQVTLCMSLCRFVWFHWAAAPLKTPVSVFSATYRLWIYSIMRLLIQSRDDLMLHLKTLWYSLSYTNTNFYNQEIFFITFITSGCLRNAHTGYREWRWGFDWQMSGCVMYPPSTALAVPSWKDQARERASPKRSCFSRQSIRWT